MKIAKFSPCKVNLMLAITGARADGFHNLVSLVAPVNFGDELSAELLAPGAREDFLECDAEGVPRDESNLVMKAASLFREASGLPTRFRFSLSKRVPAGAGLGGGSSNGAAALEAVNELCGSPLGAGELEALAGKLGSDCPLFLKKSPAVMRGRGEKVFELFEGAAACVRRIKFVIFKPEFSISTAWAYSQMRANPDDYFDADLAEARLSEWLENPSISGLPLINNMQIEAFKKFPALEIALEDIRSRFRVQAMMSGSGSACFAIVNDLDAGKIAELKCRVRSLLGEGCFIADA